MRSATEWALSTAVMFFTTATLPATAQSVPDTLRQVRLTGAVLTTDRPALALADAEVTIAGRPGRWLTDRSGRFTISGLKPGTVVLRVEHLGYAPVEDSLHLAGGLTYYAEIRLAVSPIELEGVEVTVRAAPLPRSLRAVYRRMDRATFGHFITEEDFRARGFPSVRDMLWGINLGGVPSGFSVAVYLDGVRVRGREVLDMLTQEVEILEVYNSPAGIPVQYRDPGTFAAVFIWTKW